MRVILGVFFIINIRKGLGNFLKFNLSFFPSRNWFDLYLFSTCDYFFSNISCQKVLNWTPYVNIKNCFFTFTSYSFKYLSWLFFKVIGDNIVILRDNQYSICVNKEMILLHWGLWTIIIWKMRMFMN